MGEPAKNLEPSGHAAAETKNTRTSTATVIVGSRLPWPYKLEIYEPRKEYEAVMGGGTREVTTYRRTGKSATINGNRVRVGDERRWEIKDGVGLTYGVPADIWDEWMKQHKGEDIVQNKVIFAFARVEDVLAEAKNVRAVTTGLEPYRPDGNDPRKPKPPKGESVIGDIEKGDKKDE